MSSHDKSTPVSPTIIVHGGAGWIQDHVWPDYQSGTHAAARAGQAVLESGGSAQEAVVAAVMALEDDPCFNAGTGSSLTSEGQVENDALIMLSNLRCGAVCNLVGIRNPVLAAQAVLDHSPHILMGGAGARALALAHGASACDPAELIIERRRLQWEQLKASGKSYAESLVLESMSELAGEPRDTVGALAIDSRGELAAASSTGGVMMKLPGRIGDTPIPGSGVYCGPAGAVACTGHGEAAMQVVLAKYAYDLLEGGHGVLEAARLGINHLVRLVDGKAGFILLDSRGRRAWATSTSRIAAGIPEHELDSPEGSA